MAKDYFFEGADAAKIFNIAGISPHQHGIVNCTWHPDNSVEFSLVSLNYTLCAQASVEDDGYTVLSRTEHTGGTDTPWDITVSQYQAMADALHVLIANENAASSAPKPSKQAGGFGAVAAAMSAGAQAAIRHVLSRRGSAPAATKS
jgi:hypothetical protein